MLYLAQAALALSLLAGQATASLYARDAFDEGYLRAVVRREVENHLQRRAPVKCPRGGWAHTLQECAKYVTGGGLVMAGGYYERVSFFSQKKSWEECFDI